MDMSTMKNAQQPHPLVITNPNPHPSRINDAIYVRTTADGL